MIIGSVGPVPGPGSQAAVEPVFIWALNAEAGVLEPGRPVEWTIGTNATQPSAFAVELVDTAVNATTGIDTAVAGIVHQTAATNKYVPLQIWGRDTVRASTTLASGRMVVASSVNHTTLTPCLTTAIQTTTTAPEYMGAVVGWTIESAPNATQAVVFLKLI